MTSKIDRRNEQAREPRERDRRWIAKHSDLTADVVDDTAQEAHLSTSRKNRLERTIGKVKRKEAKHKHEGLDSAADQGVVLDMESAIDALRAARLAPPDDHPKPGRPRTAWRSSDPAELHSHVMAWCERQWKLRFGREWNHDHDRLFRPDVEQGAIGQKSEALLGELTELAKRIKGHLERTKSILPHDAKRAFATVQTFVRGAEPSPAVTLQIEQVVVPLDPSPDPSTATLIAVAGRMSIAFRRARDVSVRGTARLVISGAADRAMDRIVPDAVRFRDGARDIHTRRWNGEDLINALLLSGHHWPDLPNGDLGVADIRKPIRSRVNSARRVMGKS